MKDGKLLQPTAQNGTHVGKRVLFALLVDYYLFDYWKDLVPRLIEDGFDVSILVGDYHLKQKIETAIPNVATIVLPPWMRWAYNRSGRTIPRMMLWSLAWIWAINYRRKFDFAIVPWDNRVLWYVIARIIPALTIHNTTNFIDVDLLINYVALREKLSRTLSHSFLTTIDSWMGNRLLPHANSRILHYRKSWLVDKFMGCKSPNNLQGFSGIRYFTVMGEAIKMNYQSMGVGVGKSSTEIHVVGSPSYEKIRSVKLTKTEIQAFRCELNVPEKAELFSLFLSPSSFDNASILEIRDVVETVSVNRKNSWFVMKFHPKTAYGEPEKIRQALGCIGGIVTMVTAFSGDQWNARLVLASDCLLQKQGTVGFIAMMHRIPILSYNLRATEYFDDMYEKIGGSLHATNLEELVRNLSFLEEEKGRERLARMQEVACEKYCRSDCSPCGEISGVIQDHFSLLNEKR